MDAVTVAAASLQFLRPLWLLALAALPLLVWLQHRRRRNRDTWQRAVDPHLLPHLLQTVGGRGARGAATLLTFGAALAILALAGPSWRQQSIPLWQVQSPLVIALDLSSAMRAADLPPSRLAQARYKLTALLEQRRGGQVGLLAFAGDAFTVAPITRDARTVQALLESLTPELMPVDGQRVDRAIDRAVGMLRSAGFGNGDILVVSDHADAAAQRAAARAHAAGIQVSALGIGTAAGAPVAGQQGFITDPDGQVRLARLDADSLGALATAGGGGFATLTSDAADLRALGLLDPQGRAQLNASSAHAPSDASGPGGANADAGVQRSDDGYWLLLLLLPLALFGFRRRGLAVLPFSLLLLGGTLATAPPADAASESPPQSANASRATDTSALGWAALWQREDQRARAALDRGELQAARALARDPALEGAAAFRGNDYAAAAQAWAALDNADAHYNRGNALAKAEKYEEALAAYDEALARAPGMPDAVANRKAVEEALKRQQAQEQKQQEEKKNGDSSQPQKQDGESGQSSPQNGEGQSGEPQSKPGESGEPQDRGDEAKPESEPQDGKSTEENQAQPGRDEQAAKDAAKREMQQALARAAKAQDDAPANQEGSENAAPVETAEVRAEIEQRQALEQWLRRVPDDPGGLLQRKFALEYQRRQAEGEDE